MGRYGHVQSIETYCNHLTEYIEAMAEGELLFLNLEPHENQPTNPYRLL